MVSGEIEENECRISMLCVGKELNCGVANILLSQSSIIPALAAIGLSEVLDIGSLRSGKPGEGKSWQRDVQKGISQCALGNYP